MQPADLRRSVNMTPFRTFRIHLIRSGWPIVCGYADDWCVSPSGKYFVHVDGDGRIHTIKAEEIARVEYLEDQP